MVNEKKEDKERELDSFLRSGQEIRKRRDYDDWEAQPPRRAKRGGVFGVVLVTGLVVVLLVLFFAVKELKGLKGGDGMPKFSAGASSILSDNLKIDQGKYQAVFLTNGQVYFGKIGIHDGSYVELDDIYYLQVKPVLQQGDNGNDNKGQDQKTELSLVKLGNELHGPLDRMMINRDQIVFVEDLKDDSKVADAIHRYQQGQR